MIAFGSGTSTSHQVQFKELLKELFEVGEIKIKEQSSLTLYGPKAKPKIKQGHCNGVTELLT